MSNQYFWLRALLRAFVLGETPTLRSFPYRSFHKQVLSNLLLSTPPRIRLSYSLQEVSPYRHAGKDIPGVSFEVVENALCINAPTFPNTVLPFLTAAPPLLIVDTFYRLAQRPETSPWLSVLTSTTVPTETFVLFLRRERNLNTFCDALRVLTLYRPISPALRDEVLDKWERQVDDYHQMAALSATLQGPV